MLYRAQSRRGELSLVRAMSIEIVRYLGTGRT